jgi:hypothetical protein
VSLLSRNQLDIVLYPKQISLLRATRKLTLHGYKTEVYARKVVDCEMPSDGEMPWQQSIRTLEMTLPSFIGFKPEVNVTLSNQFVQYLLVPWIDKMSDEEELVFAQQCFREIYGDAADSWSVRVSPGRAGIASLACAIDTRLLEALRGSLEEMGLDIKSIQPHLMEAFNSCHSTLEGRNAWVALLEPGSLCLGLLRMGQLAWIRKLPIGDAWSNELSGILQREAYLADTGTEVNEVLLWSPHLEELDIQPDGRWKIMRLPSSNKFGCDLDLEGMQTLVAG